MNSALRSRLGRRRSRHSASGFGFFDSGHRVDRGPNQATDRNPVAVDLPISDAGHVTAWGKDVLREAVHENIFHVELVDQFVVHGTHPRLGGGVYGRPATIARQKTDLQLPESFVAWRSKPIDPSMNNRSAPSPRKRRQSKSCPQSPSTADAIYSRRPA